MNYIKIGDEFINLDRVISISDRTAQKYTDNRYVSAGSVVIKERVTEGFEAPEIYIKNHKNHTNELYADALVAWLNVPNHMAGVIDPLDRDVMAWWEREQKRDATENEA